MPYYPRCGARPVKAAAPSSPETLRLSRWTAYIENLAAWALFALMALVASSVTARWLFNFPFPDWYDLSRLLLGIAVFWGIAAACGRDDYIRGDIFWNYLPDRLRYWIDAVGRLLILVFLLLVAWKFFDKTIDVRTTGQETSELRLKIWPFYAIAWVGTLLAVAVLGAQIWSGFRGVQEQAAAPGAGEDAQN